jgi:hypothetical protein
MNAVRQSAGVPQARLFGSACLILLAVLFLSLWAPQPPAAFAASGAASGAGSGSTAATFLSNLDDIPLMPGLTERKDLAVSYDKPEGRIVEAFAVGRLSSAAVSKFSASTLPQLGWRDQGNNRFAREGEELILNFTTAAKKLTVQFSLSPKS